MKAAQRILLVMAVSLSLVLTLSHLRGESGDAGGASFFSSASAALPQHSADGHVDADHANGHGGLGACPAQAIDCVPTVPAIANDGQDMNWATAATGIQWYGHFLGAGLLLLPPVPPPETI